MKQLAAVVAILALVVLVSPAQAQDNPNGTWKWTVEFGGQTREVTLKLKLDGDKLTGTMSGRNNTETAIEEGKYKDGAISFKVTRERNGQKTTTTYTGKVSGDTIKGKSESTVGGEARSRDFEAKRAK